LTGSAQQSTHQSELDPPYLLQNMPQHQDPVQQSCAAPNTIEGMDLDLNQGEASIDTILEGEDNAGSHRKLYSHAVTGPRKPSQNQHPDLIKLIKEWIVCVRTALSNAKEIGFDKNIWNRDEILAAFLDPIKFK